MGSDIQQANRFGAFTREEIHLLRDVMNFYLNARERESDPEGVEIIQRLMPEMRDSVRGR